MTVRWILSSALIVSASTGLCREKEFETSWRVVVDWVDHRRIL